jgi:hypothetical protein
MSSAAPITNADCHRVLRQQRHSAGLQIHHRPHFAEQAIASRRHAGQGAAANSRRARSRRPRPRFWLTNDMVAAIEPMDDQGYALASEARKLDAGKILDVFADHFATFAVLNPSLIAALKMMPGSRGRVRAAA